MRRAGSIASVLAVLLAAGALSGGARAGGEIICIDPGHGGTEPGAANGALEEKDINLDVAYAVSAQLTSAGYTVVMTRNGNETLSSNDRYTFCNNEQATILVSIHTNSSSSPSADGTLAIYFHEDDRVLAAAIQQTTYETLLPGTPDGVDFVDRGLKRDALGVLLKSAMPAATIEPLFMSNPGEAGLLAQSIHQVDAAGVVILDSSGAPALDPGCGGTCRRQQIADGVAAGILAYLQAPPPPPDGGGGGGGGGKGGCGSPPCGKR